MTVNNDGDISIEDDGSKGSQPPNDPPSPKPSGNPKVAQLPKGKPTPESRLRSSPKSSPEATSVNNGNINPLTGTSLTWEDPKDLT